MAQTDFREVEFSFRFVKLAPDIAGRLRQQLSRYGLQSRRPDVVALPLLDKTDYGPLIAFLDSENLGPGTYSVWASIVTSSDHGGVSLPAYVLEIVRKTGAGVDLSFVACIEG